MRKETQVSTHSIRAVRRTGTAADPSFMYNFEFTQWLVEMLKTILEVSLLEGSLISRVVLLSGCPDLLQGSMKWNYQDGGSFALPKDAAMLQFN